MRNILFLSIVLSLTSNAYATTVSTGDLGENIISSGESFSVLFNLTSPSNQLYSFIDIKYGLWDSPNVLVDTFVNGAFVGTFAADQGYNDPGPEFVSFSVVGTLLDGSNEILFLGDSLGDYVIGQVDLTYSAVPLPSAVWLFGSGLICLIGIIKNS